MFLFLRDKISKRIHSWSHRYLSFGGRLTLIKSTLGAIPLHIFQVMEPTIEARKQMESIIARFFWGSNDDVKRIHWISWSKICHPVEEGGLGIRSLKEMQEAFSMKLWWRYREQETLWARFMFKKYGHIKDEHRDPPSKNHSPTWKRIARVSNNTQKLIRWSVGDGTANFWDDIWLKNETMRSLCSTSLDLPRKQIKDFWVNNSWDVSYTRNLLSSFGVQSENIEEVLNTPIEVGGRDEMRWELTPHGNFTTKSAWEWIRDKQPVVNFLGSIWNQVVPPTVSIFVWRLLADRIPVDAKLQWRKIALASKCRCCTAPREETREHLFLNGEPAKKIWRVFSDWFPDDQVNMETRESEETEGLVETEGNMSIEERIRQWSNNMTNPTKGHIKITLPLLILWNIWTERNHVIHRGAVFNTELVIERINQCIQGLILARKLGAQHWTGTSLTISFTKPTERTKRTQEEANLQWRPPSGDWIKVNTDGDFTASGMLAGGGGVVRDVQGQLLECVSAPLEASSGLEAELKAIILGIRMAKRWGDRIWIETGAKETVSIIEAKSNGPAAVRHIVTELRNLIKTYKCRVSHIIRNGNKAAESLAKHGKKLDRTQFFDIGSAPHFVKEIVEKERIGRQ